MLRNAAHSKSADQDRGPIGHALNCHVSVCYTLIHSIAPPANTNACGEKVQTSRRKFTASRGGCCAGIYTDRLRRETLVRVRGWSDECEENRWPALPGRANARYYPNSSGKCHATRDMDFPRSAEGPAARDRPATRAILFRRSHRQLLSPGPPPSVAASATRPPLPNHGCPHRSTPAQRQSHALSRRIAARARRSRARFQSPRNAYHEKAPHQHCQFRSFPSRRLGVLLKIWRCLETPFRPDGKLPPSYCQRPSPTFARRTRQRLQEAVPWQRRLAMPSKSAVHREQQQRCFLQRSSRNLGR